MKLEDTRVSSENLKNISAPEAREEVPSHKNSNTNNGSLSRGIRNAGGEELRNLSIIPLSSVLPCQSDMGPLANDYVRKPEEERIVRMRMCSLSLSAQNNAFGFQETAFHLPEKGVREEEEDEEEWEGVER